MSSGVISNNMTGMSREELVLIGYFRLNSIISSLKLENFEQQTGLKKDVLLNQLERKGILKSNTPEFIIIRYDDLFSERYVALQLMKQSDYYFLRYLAGYILFKGEIRHIGDIFDFFNNRKNRIFNQFVSIQDLNQQICLLTLDQEIVIVLNESGWILSDGKIHTEIPRREITSIPNFEWINFEALLGMLGKNRILSIKSIKKYFDRISNQSLTEFEVILILSSLVRDGVLEATLDVDNTVLIQNIRFEKSSFLTKQERILIGYLVGSENPTVDELSTLLKGSIDQINDLIDQFGQSSSIEIHISRDQSIMTNGLKSIPITTQITLLPNQFQEIYGFISNKKIVYYKEIKDIWLLAFEEIQLIFYELIGYGLLQAKIYIDKLEIIGQEIPKQIRLYDIPAKLENILAKIQQSEIEEIDLRELIKESDFTTTDLIKELSMLQNCNIFPTSRITNSKFFHKGDLNLLGQFSFCINCGSKIQLNHDKCVSCGQEHLYCLICRGLLINSKQISKCPNCHQQGHSNHFSDWLTLRPQCPACREELNISQLEKIT